MSQESFDKAQLIHFEEYNSLLREQYDINQAKLARIKKFKNYNDKIKRSRNASLNNSYSQDQANQIILDTPKPASK